MTTRQIVAIVLFYIGLQQLCATVLYVHVWSGGGSDASMLASYILGTAFIVAGIVALRWKKEAGGFGFDLNPA
jgi:hypothetical protein